MFHFVLAAFIALGSCQNFLALNKACEGWFCETEHVELISFTSAEPSSYKVLSTIYPSSPYNTVEKLTFLHTFDSVSRTYYVLLQDPSASKATLIGYNIISKKMSQVPTTFGAKNLNWDSKSKTLLAAYSGVVYQISPITGQRKAYFNVFSTSQHPSYSDKRVSFWLPTSALYSELVFFGHADPAANCYYVYQVNAATNQTTISQCFPDNDAGSSLGEYSTLYMNQWGGKFFAVTYDVLGANYQFLYPANYSIISTVLDFQDFAGIGWQVNPDKSSFTYSPITQTLWATVEYSEDDGTPTTVLGGVTIPSGNVQQSGAIGEWSNIQVIYGHD